MLNPHLPLLIGEVLRPQNDPKLVGVVVAEALATPGSPQKRYIKRTDKRAELNDGLDIASYAGNRG